MNLIPPSLRIGAGLTAFAATIACGQTQLIIPGDYASTIGSTGDVAPLGATNQHMQQEYAASLLTSSGLAPGDQITAIGFRVADGDPSLAAQTVSDYSIWMGVGAFSPGHLSSTFADNGSGMALVRSGALTISSGQFAGGTGPNPFGMIQLAAPYTYAGGDLLIEISYSGFVNGVTVDTVYPYANSLAETAFGTGSGATTADVGQFNEAIIMAFSVTAVPEASTMALFACGVIGFGFLSSCRRLK
jgi:hypothetical protein